MADEQNKQTLWDFIVTSRQELLHEDIIDSAPFTVDIDNPCKDGSPYALRSKKRLPLHDIAAVFAVLFALVAYAVWIPIQSMRLPPLVSLSSFLILAHFFALNILGNSSRTAKQRILSAFINLEAASVVIVDQIKAADDKDEKMRRQALDRHAQLLRCGYCEVVKRDMRTARTKLFPFSILKKVSELYTTDLKTIGLAPAVVAGNGRMFTLYSAILELRDSCSKTVGRAMPIACFAFYVIALLSFVLTTASFRVTIGDSIFELPWWFGIAAVGAFGYITSLQFLNINDEAYPFGTGRHNFQRGKAFYELEMQTFADNKEAPEPQAAT